jgi:hypothetical protein
VVSSGEGARRRWPAGQGAAADERVSDAASHPLVRTVLSRFPGAAIVDVRDTAPADEAPALAHAAAMARHGRRQDAGEFGADPLGDDEVSDADLAAGADTAYTDDD